MTETLEDVRIEKGKLEAYEAVVDALEQLVEVENAHAEGLSVGEDSPLGIARAALARIRGK